MSFDQELREQLTRSANSIEIAPAAQLDDVIGSARRRRRTRQVVVAAVTIALVAIAAVGIPRVNLATQQTPPVAPPQLRPPSTAVNSPSLSISRLTGEWVSAPVAAQRIRSSILAAGLTKADASRLLGQAQRWQTSMIFPTHPPRVQIRSWNPGRGSSDSVPVLSYGFDVLPDSELVLTTPDFQNDLHLSYTVRAHRLSLQFVTAEPDQLSPETAALVASWTAAPLRKVR